MKPLEMLGLCSALLAACATTAPVVGPTGPTAAPAEGSRSSASVPVAELVRQRKYESAFKLLAKEDPDHQSPDLVLEKIRVATGYFVKSINYEFFALKDLEAGEDLLTLRKGAVPAVELYALDVPAVLAPLQARHPNDHRLTLALGNYHYERMVRFPGMEVDPALPLGLLQKAAEHGAADAESLSRLGACLLMQGEPEKALKSFEASLARDPANPATHYNAAAIYHQRGALDEAMAHARTAYEGYGRPEYARGASAKGEDAGVLPRQRSEAIRLVGIIQATKDDLPAARESFKQAVALYPEDPNARRFQYDTELKLGLTDAACATATEALVHDPRDLEAYQLMLAVFDHYRALPRLRGLLEALLPRYLKDAEATGMVRFFAGETCYALEDLAAARVHHERARESFGKVFPADHPVFRILDDRLPQAAPKKP